MLQTTRMPEEVWTMEPPPEIELEGATIRRRENGIVEIVVAEKAEVTLERAQAMFAAVQELCHAPRPVLVDIRAARGTGITSMRYAVGPEVAAMTRKLALLIGSPVSRMIGSVFLGMWRPPYPTRLFTDEEAAVTWLLADSAENAIDHDDAARDRGDERAQADRARVGDDPAAG
jgi:hypothetical protein